MMNDTGVFFLKDVNMQENRAFIETVGPLLQSFGLKMELNEDDDCILLRISFSEIDNKIMMRRNAGRNKKRADKKERLTFGEVKQIMKEIGSVKMAERLEISRTTLFRRLKSYRIENRSDNDKFA